MVPFFVSYSLKVITFFLETRLGKKDKKSGVCVHRYLCVGWCLYYKTHITIYVLMINAFSRSHRNSLLKKHPTLLNNLNFCYSNTG